MMSISWNPISNLQQGERVRAREENKHATHNMPNRWHHSPKIARFTNTSTGRNSSSASDHWNCRTASSGSSKSTTRPRKKLIVGAVSSYLSPVIQHNDQIIFVKGSIKEKEIDFLLDTGAEITVIPTKLAQGLNIPYKKTKLCLTGVIGEDSVFVWNSAHRGTIWPKNSDYKIAMRSIKYRCNFRHGSSETNKSNFRHVLRIY